MAAAHPEFNRLMEELDSPMLIVTTAAAGERDGCLVAFSSQVSIHPPRFLACLSVKNRTYRVATAADVLVVHFVPEDEERLAELFGGETGDQVDKFARCDWTEGPGGAPVLTELEDWFVGRILERLDLGDHWGFLLEPIEGHAKCSGSPLRFRRAKRIQAGHEP